VADSPTIIKDIQPGRNLVIGTISRLSSHRIRNGNLMIEATISDTSGAISCVWFKSILPKDLVEGNEYEFTGNYELKYGRHALQMPKYVATGNKPSLDYLKSVPYVLPNNQPKKTLWSRVFFWF
jgi:RecG-like helicase